MQNLTISDGKNLSVTLSDYGARIIAIDFKGESLALGYDTKEKYLADQFYLGASIGPITNRIAHGKLSIHEQEFQMPCNEGKHSLHSGGVGFDKLIWQLKSQQSNSLCYELDFDLETVGLAGKLNVLARYAAHNGALSISYTSQCDTDTYINLTNHVYLNLNGNGNSGGDVLNHRFNLLADSFVDVDGESIPNGKTIGLKSPFEYSLSTPSVSQLDGACDHHFNAKPSPESKKREIFNCISPSSSISLSVLSNSPGFQFYTGRFLSEPFAGSAGFCVETQLAPDAINQTNFESPLLLANEVREQVTEYHFS